MEKSSKFVFSKRVFNFYKQFTNIVQEISVFYSTFISPNLIPRNVPKKSLWEGNSQEIMPQKPKIYLSVFSNTKAEISSERGYVII